MFPTFRLSSHNTLRRTIITLLLTLIVLLAMLGARSRTPRPAVVHGSVAPTPDRLIDPAAVDAFMLANLQRTGLPGVALAITNSEGVVYTAGYGHDSAGNAITPDTPMPIGSLSKSITALAVMQLVEQGTVDLDTPVQAYLPEFVLADPRGARITVRHVLNQTSGMADARFPEMELPQPDTLQAAVARLRVATLVADPGTEFNYHNPNYQVAARLVEVVSGEPFAAYLHQHVFAPLGMPASRTLDRAEQTIPDIANGYVLTYGQAVAVPILPHFFNGAGGVVSTANDLARWLILQNNAGTTADGRQIISAQSIAAMHTPSERGDYALGWDTDILADGTTRIEHGGTPFTFSAHQALFPATGYSFAVLFNSCNAFGVEQISFIDGLTALVNGDPPAQGVPASVIADGVLAFFTLAALTGGIHQARRAHVWAAHRAAAPRWRTGLRLGMHLLPLGIFVYLPTLAGWVLGNRDVTWTSALYGWLALVVWLAIVAVMQSWIVASRAVHLMQRYRTWSWSHRWGREKISHDQGQ